MPLCDRLIGRAKQKSRRNDISQGTSTKNCDLANADLTEFGAGITLYNRTRYILRELGLEEALKSKSLSPPMGCRKSDTQNGYTFKTFGESGNTGAIAVHRVEMLNLLSKELTADTKPAGIFNVRFSKRMTSYTQDSSGVTLNFEDGSFAQADILIGADGIGSPTRKTMYTGLSERARGTNPEHADDLMTHALPIWTGIYIYRFLVDSAKIQAIKPDHIALSKGISWCGSGSVGLISYSSEMWL
ncbi:hypothetical protein QCA50_003562 [Cerrena zonata]|uniref:FAD-binding domain-containing protein n=1 Tax=Cerrena zonata TaxID=2478898 RepID=A0AAW0GV85_9APHY